jgi:NAD(P)-binding Rossmann-like domain
VQAETDYLVIGGGASGLAFADSLIAEDPDAELTLIERRSGPGGHWLDAYPFVRLHIPSAFYGVNSLRLGEDRIDDAGENAGFYERATGAEINDYFAEVAANLTDSGRVQFVFGHEHVDPGAGGGRVRDLRSGDVTEIGARRRVVDARYLEASIPATGPGTFEVDPGARVVPVNDLPTVVDSAERFTVLGAGKTAVDACTWLLEAGVAPERIRWIRPRDMWFHHRRHFQPLDLVGENMDGISLDAEAAANATDIDDLFDRLEESGRLFRIDPTHRATMYRGTMLSPGELEAVRRIEDVVRLGRVQRIEPDRIILERGEVETSRDVVHVDCTAYGLRAAPTAPIFAEDRIVIQQVRQNSPTFNAALIAFVEARRENDEDRNRLCPPNPYASGIDDWPGMTRRTFEVEQQWLGEPDLGEWIAASRLNLLRGLPERAGDPKVQAALERFLSNVGPATERLAELEPSAA